MPTLYRPLHTNTGTTQRIRLLTLAPGDYHDPIKIELAIHDLDEHLPTYDALSYVWGDAMSDAPAMVNGCPRHITENLATALKHLRCPKSQNVIERTKKDAHVKCRNDCLGEEERNMGDRVLWIDALCIDQRNVEERNHQVKLMSRIYHSARRVVIWLGPSDDSSDFVMDCVAAAALSRSQFGHIAPENEAYFILHATKLLNRPWFERIWVVQEVARSTSAIVQCGNRLQPLSAFLNVFKKLGRKWDYLRHEYDTSLLPAELHPCWYQLVEERRCRVRNGDGYAGIGNNRGTLDRDKVHQEIIVMVHDFIELFVSALLSIDAIAPARDGNLPFPHALLSTEERKASDPRDKVFALLGMCENWWAQIPLPITDSPLTADYTKDTATVYSEAMVVILQHGFEYGYPRLPLRLPEKDKIRNLPSWVPDLSICRVFQLVAECHLSDKIEASPFDPSPLRPGAKEFRRARQECAGVSSGSPLLSELESAACTGRGHGDGGRHLLAAAYFP